MISSHVTNNWLTITIVLLIFLIVFLHYLYPSRFNKLLSLIRFNEYFIIYLDKKPPIIVIFNGLLLFFQLGVYALLLFKIQLYYQYADNGLALYLRIYIVLFIFFISRYLLGKIIAYIFRVDKLHSVLSLVKFTYLSKTAIYIFPLLLIMVYLKYNNFLLLQITTVLTILLLLFYYVKLVLQNQKIILRNLFYFILYLCTLEIIPLVYLFRVIF